MSDSMTGFMFNIPTRIEYGTDKFRQIGFYLKGMGTKALIVSSAGSSLKELQNECRKLLKKEGIQSVLFAEVVSNPGCTLIDRGCRLAVEEGCDLIIGLGGGSAMDAAKAIAVVAVEKVGIWQIVEGRDITGSPLPLVTVPTTSGTGSEVTQYSVISNPDKLMKEGIGKREFYPVLSIVDPLLTLSMPAGLTAAVGLDALSHAIEGYTTVNAGPLTDIMAETAIGLIGKSLREAVFSPDDINARADMTLASMLAGMAITHADTSLAHVIGEAVGAVFNVHHGLAVILALPAVMEFNCFTNIEKFKKIAELLGEPIKGVPVREAAIMAPGALRKLIHDLGVPRGLSALGVTEDERVLALCTRPGTDSANLRPASEDDFKALIRGSLSAEMSYWDNT
jgi:alcohol dehydrogenase